MHLGQVAALQVLCDLAGIAAIGLDPLPGLPWHQAGRHYLAADPELGQLPLQRVAIPIKCRVQIFVFLITGDEFVEFFGGPLPTLRLDQVAAFGERQVSTIYSTAASYYVILETATEDRQFEEALARLTRDESDALLGYLFKHLTQEAFVYRHRWAPDMLTLWDNRCTVHAVTPHDPNERRVMHRTTIVGRDPVVAA